MNDTLFVTQTLSSRWIKVFKSKKVLDSYLSRLKEKYECFEIKPNQTVILSNNLEITYEKALYYYEYREISTLEEGMEFLKLSHTHYFKVFSSFYDSIEKALNSSNFNSEETNRILKGIIFAKFYQNSDLYQKLLSTGYGEILADDVYDKYFGLIEGKGRNVYGRALMKVRDTLRQTFKYTVTYMNKVLIRSRDSEELKEALKEVITKESNNLNLKERLKFMSNLDDYIVIKKLTEPKFFEREEVPWNISIPSVIIKIKDL